MKFFSTFAAATSAVVVLSAAPASAKFGNGLPWAADNNWAKKIPEGAISWYHHWERGYVPQMPKGTEYVPTFWGPEKWDDWNQRKSEISKHNSKHILAFNEPDVASQANMSPDEAVSLFMKELQPYAEQGIRVSSPQMVFNMDWLNQFMDKCHSAGCNVSFMALHWYGSYKDMDKFQNWVKNVHKNFNLPIWVTEFGITAESNPSQDQVNKFADEAIKWMAKQDYVERAAWNGCYDISTPPDQYATPLNAMFNNGGSFRQLANIWLPALAAAGLHHKENHSSGNSRRHAQMIKRSPSFKAETAKRNNKAEKKERKPLYSFGPGKKPLVRIAFPKL